MFSGIIAAIGQITASSPLHHGRRLTVDVGAWDIDDVALGDSIAVQGVCLTVVEKTGRTLSFDVSRETLQCTVGLDALGPVNLEKALRLADRLGGHLVSGHVDGIGTVAAFSQKGESWQLDILAPQTLSRFIAQKGSITVDGVSLTVNAIEGSLFSVNLIPHTVAVTTLQRLTSGARVNLEIDLIARYLARMIDHDQQAAT
jgi:riboflavin synthase